jgi:hypothetical protein
VLSPDRDQERLLSRIMANSVEASTERGMMNPIRAFDLWTTYLHKKHCTTPGAWRLDGFNHNVWTRRVLLYLTWLHQGGEDPKRNLRALTHYLKLRGHTPAVLVNNPDITGFFKGLGKVSGTSSRSRGRSILRFVRRKLPAPMELLTRSRALLWNPEPATQLQRMTALAYLVIMLQYVTARRISNFTHTLADRSRARKKTVAVDPDDKHALTMRDVLVASNEGAARGLHPSKVKGSDTVLTAAFDGRGISLA